jgi:RNA polymerase sigma-70 factor, ECF subfamily
MSDPFADEVIALLPNLRRFAISLSRTRDTADDLVQMTVERAFASRASFDPTTRLDAWLFRILRNAWYDMLRRTKTRGTEVDIADAPEAMIVDGEKTVENSLMLKSAEVAIHNLPADQREVILLICVEELSYKEAAETLGIPIGTVMSRLSRARIAISHALGINPPMARSPGRAGDT